MIIDTLQNAKTYENAHKHFAKAFAFLKKAVAENLPLGRYEIEGEEAYALVQEYTTKPREEGKPEGHRKYIDIQYIMAGAEGFLAADIGVCTATTEYNAEKDFLLFENGDTVADFTLKANDFAVFFPWDVHTPGLAVNQIPGVVKKIVVKIAV